MIGYARFLTLLLLGSSRYIAEAVIPRAPETACDFLQDLDGGILPAKAYYENESHILQQLLRPTLIDIPRLNLF